jgi:hypothetical protein
VKEVVEFSILKLQSNCPSHGVIKALGVIFPQYWMMVDFKPFIKKHIRMIKA